MRSVSFIGYGELADALGGGLTDAGVHVRAYVRPRSDGGAARARRERMLKAGVEACGTIAAAVSDVDVVIAAVPAAAASEVVDACVRHLRPGQLYVDPTSSLPNMKRSAAESVELTGAEYVDVAVVGTVVTAGARVPMLAAGRGAARWEEEALALGLNVTAIDGAAGDAALVKLLRSVFMKGRDALVLEMLLAARRYGVHEAVLASIGGPAEQVPFPSLADRVMCSLAVYAERRADELADAASLLDEAGVDPVMTLAGESRLRLFAATGLRTRFGGERPRDLNDVLSALDSLDSARA